MYRKAVLEDVNQLDVNDGGFCAKLWNAIRDSVLSTDHHTDFNDASRLPPERQAELVELHAAHLLAIATACHEVYTGTSGASFQIGGREKLQVICWQIAEQVVDSDLWVLRESCEQREHERCAKNRRKCNHSRLHAEMDHVLAEIIELTQSVFQRRQRSTTVAFSLCAAAMWGRLACEQTVQVTEHQSVSCRSLFDCGSSTARQASEAWMLALRKDLYKSLKRQSTKDAVRKLVQAWWSGHECRTPPEPPTRRTTAVLLVPN